MPFTLSGNGGTVAEVDGTVWRSMRTTVRPPEYSSGGYYSMWMNAVTAAAPAALAELASFRWGSATLICLVQKVTLIASVTVASTAGEVVLGAFVARGFTASDSAGTAVTLTGNAFKKRTSLPTTAVTDARFAAGGVLTAGTRTADGQAFAQAHGGFSAFGPGPAMSFDATGPNGYPIVLAQNEGLVFRNVVALTTAVYQYSIGIEWAEVAAY